MRSTLLVGIAFCCYLPSYSQNVFPAYGKVGIGTNSPVAELHLVTGNWNKLQIDGTNTSGLDRIGINSSGNDLFFGAAGSAHATTGHVKTSGSFYSFNGVGGISIAATNGSGHIRLYTGGQANQHERFRIEQQGKLFAFGVTRVSTLRDSMVSMDPITKEFQISPVSVARMSFIDNRSVATTPVTYNNSFLVQLKNNSTIGLPAEGSGLSSTLGLRGGNADNLGKSHELAFSDNNQMWLRSGFNAAWGGWKKVIFDSAGIVRIGTTSSRAEVHINGEMFTRKVKVTQNGWPDYVFREDYTLLDLYKLEQFIKNNNHLPEVPSAEEVEQNGLDLGNGQAILLKKIEELTLYTIQQQKQIDALAEQNKQLASKIRKRRRG